MRYTKDQNKILEQETGVLFVKSVAGSGLTTILAQKAYIEQQKLNKHEAVKLLDCNFCSTWANKRIVNIQGYCQRLQFESLNNFVTNKLLLHKNGYSSLDQNELFKIVKEVEKELGVKKGDLLREYIKHSLTGIAPTDETILLAIGQIEDIKSTKKYVTSEDAFHFFENNQSLLQAITTKYPCIIVDNFHNSDLKQVQFIRSLAEHTRLLIVGSDECQSINNNKATVIERNKFYDDYKSSSITLNRSFTVSKENYALASAIAKSIGKQSKLKTTIKGSKPIYKEFSNNEQQSDYIETTIKKLTKSGVSLSDCAILSRTKAPLVGMQLILNNEGITTNNAFYSHSHYCEYIQSLNSLVNIVKSIINSGTVPIEDAIRIISHFDIENNDSQILLDKVQAGGIKKFKISRIKHGRTKSDRFLKIQQALLLASTLYPEEGIQVLLDSLKPVFNPKLYDSKIITGLLSRFKLNNRNIEDWNDVALFSMQEKNDNGVTLCSFHKAIGGHWKHVFIINVVNDIVPFTKYKFNKYFMDDETGLFYSSITRATETAHVLYCPYDNHKFVDKKNGEKKLNHGHLDEKSPFVKNYFNLYSTVKSKNL